uniref:Glutathione peroxidase n=1 Tax=Capra hircus TaxID=9925 RepID=A0A452E3I3_CAPHI
KSAAFSTAESWWWHWLLLASMAGMQQQQDTSNLKAVNIQGKLVSQVVNAASKWGFIDQPQHFNVLAFPCNQCGQQEPDSSKIQSFAPKIAVASTGVHPAFKYLMETSGKKPSWNFWKYLVAPDGKVVGAWDPSMTVEEIRLQVTALVMKLILKKQEDL